MESDVQVARDALVEMVAEADDALMEKFFDAGTLTQEELISGLKRGIAAGRIFPLLCTSAAANVGIQPLLDAIVNCIPSPAERGVELADDSRLAASDSGPAAAFVWKTVADPFAGRITMFRVLSGTLKSDSTVHNADARDRPSVSATWCCCRARPRRTFRRSRRGTSARWRS